MANLIPAFIQAQRRQQKRQGSLAAYVLFLDIAGFTSITERLMAHGSEGAEVLTSIINDIYEPVIRRIYAAGGFIATFAGDAFTAIYPEESDIAPLAASWEIEELFQQQGRLDTPLGSFDIRIKQGLAYGRVDWGLVGGEALAYYFRGPAVDQSAQLQDYAEPGQIIVHDDAVGRLAESAAVFETVVQGICRLVKADLNPLPAEAEGQELALAEIEPFLSPALSQGELGAEFRDIISVFVSFGGMDEHERLDEFAHFVLPLSRNYGGHINGFDFGDKGGKILIQFGLPVAYEDGLLRALGFAWEIKERWSNQVRIGVSQGRSYAGPLGSSLRATYTGMGDAVNQAARIMVKAPWGEVWLSENVARNGEEGFAVSERGEFALKGKSEKTTLFALTGPRERSLTREDGAFVDRNEERKRVADFVVEPGATPFFLLVGENGVGKSRLISQVVTELKNYQVVFLPANPLAAKSYYPFIYFLQRFFGQSLDQVNASVNPYDAFEKELAAFVDAKESGYSGDLQERQEGLRRRFSLLAALLGLRREGSLYERLDAQGRSDNTVQALRDFFVLLARRKETILFLEDFHAVDPASLAVLAELLPLSRDHSLPLVMAGRDTPQGWAELAGQDGGAELTLPALAQKDLAELVDQLLPGPADKKLHKLIYDRTQGNPFFAEQLVNYLQEQDGLATDEQGRRYLVQDPHELPSGINSILVARVDRLSAPAKKLIQTASLLGLTVDRRIMDSLDDIAEVTEAHYQEAQSKGIWSRVEEGEYRFASDMMRQAAYTMQLKEVLRKRHKQIGEQMERLYVGNKNAYADLARHFDEGGDQEKSLYYYNLAARTAVDEYRNQEARELFAKLLRLPMPQERYLEAAMGYIDVLEVLGEWGWALDWIDDLENKELDFYQRNFLGKKKADIWQKQGDYPRARVKIDVVIHDLAGAGLEGKQNQSEQTSASGAEPAKEGPFWDGEANDQQLTSLLAQSYQVSGRVFWSQAQYDDSIAAYGHSLALSGRLLDRQGEALALYFIGVNYRDKGDFASAQSYYERALEIFDEIEDKRFLTYPLYDLAYLYQVQGELDAAEERFGQVLSIYEEIGYRSGLAAALLNLGVTQARKGDFERALANQEESLRMVEQMGEKMAVAYTLFALGVTYFQQREYEVSVGYLRDSLKTMQEIQSRGYFGFVYSYLGYVYSLMGKINLTLKTALRNLIHIRRTGTDVEQGLVYLTVGLVVNRLQREKEAGKKPRRVLEERLSKICRLTGLPCEPEPFLAEAVARSEKNHYLTTYMPALREYARYLFYRQQWQKGKSYWNKAYGLARDKGLQLELGRLERLQRKFELGNLP